MATSASGINFTGLASGRRHGVDRHAADVDRARARDAHDERHGVENARKAALQDISTKLLSLRTAADALRSIPFWAGDAARHERRRLARTRSTSRPARPKANYQIQVKRLATGEVWAHDATSGVRDFGAAMRRPERVRRQDHDADRP